MTIQPLPVPTRIFGGEGLISYASRHAARNGTTVEKIERSLSEVGAFPKPSHRRTPERLQAWRSLGALHESAFATPAVIDGADPETVRIARLVTDPGFNTRMLQPGLRARERHAMSVKASTGFFPRAEDNEPWRVAHRITAMFNAIAGEIERNPFRMGGATPSSTPLAQAWKIWGR